MIQGFINYYRVMNDFVFVFCMLYCLSIKMEDVFSNESFWMCGYLLFLYFRNLIF